MSTQQGIYDYLAKTGVLETGDDTAIKAAKKEYWKEYRNAWKQQHRKQHMAYTILFTPKEAKHVGAEAKQLHTSPTRYIKLSALTGNQKMSKELTGEIRMLLFQHIGEVENLLEENKIQETIAQIILEKFITLEKQILKNCS